jgi:hypothetical protein
MVVLTQQLRVCCAVIAGMCEDDGNGLVEEVEFVQDFGEVWSTIDAAVCVCGDYGYVVLTVTN